MGRTPDWFHNRALRLRALFRRRQLEHDLQAELQFHVEMRESAYEARGLSPQDAHAAARRRTGNVTRFKEVCREMWTFASFERLLQDTRYACRMLRKNPAITIVAVLSLALGIGANAAMFSIVNGILFRPLRFPEPDRLVRVTGSYPQGAVADMQRQSRSMDLSGYSTDAEFNLTGAGQAIRIPGSSVSANLFQTLGSQPELGRTFRPGEDRPGLDRLIVLSHSLWRGKFGGDASVIGRMVTIDGVARQVIGVMPADFGFPAAATQFWIPLHLDPGDEVNYWDTGYMPIIGRLRPGATIAQARNELRGLVDRIFPLFPWKMPRTWNADATVRALRSDIVGDVRPKLLVLFCAVGFVLLIACANVASLLLSLSAARRKELALRASIGASRGRIIQQLLTESVVLSLAGAALGLALAFWTSAILKSALPADTPRLAEVGIDWRVLAFVTVLAVITGLAFGLAPAFHTSRIDLAGAMKAAGQRATGTGGVRLRSWLTAGEIALAVVLLTGAGLLIRSLWILMRTDPGFRPEHVLTIRVSPDRSLCRKRENCIALYRDLVRDARAVDGVLDAAASNAVPMGGETPAVPMQVEGRTPGELAPMPWAGAITPGYFHLMRIPLLQGRTFTDADSETAPPVIVVSASTARLFWPGEDAVGKHVRVVWENRPRTVVGIVGDVRQYDLANHSPSWLSGAVYMPYAQSVGLDRQLPVTMDLLVRTAQNPSRVGNELRRTVEARNPNVPVSDVRTLTKLVNASTSASRSMMWLFTAFAAAALLLAAIGTYGVMSYSVSQRTYEVGVRVALGATRAGILRLILGQALRLALIGLAAGTIVSLALTRMLAKFLYGVAPSDPATLLAAAGVLLLTALLSGYGPARRAGRIDPLTALRVN